jgi:hypothetical protein
MNDPLRPYQTCRAMAAAAKTNRKPGARASRLPIGIFSRESGEILETVFRLFHFSLQPLEFLPGVPPVTSSSGACWTCMICQSNRGNILKMPKMPKSVQFRPVGISEGSMNPHNPNHNPNLNLRSANHSPARIPVAPLENAVKGWLDGGRKVAGWTEGQSRSVKLSQTSVGKG